MRIRHTLPWISAATAIIRSTAALGAQQSLVLVPVRVDQVMTAAQQRQTGVDRLTPAERFALDGWLTRYTAELRLAASTAPAPANDSAPVAATPPDADSAIGEPGQAADVAANDAAAAPHARWPRWLVPLTVPPGAPLASTREDGEYIGLADGTLWEIYLPDRTATVLWRAGDYIVVQRAATGVNVGVSEYDYVLANAPARTRAFARFIGLAQRRRR